MERRDFLNAVGVSMALACAGCLAACSKSSNSITPGGNNGSGVSVDLTTQLQNVGDSIFTNGIIVVRLATGNTASSFTAVSAYCTHQGTVVSYIQGQGLFYCPSHGSEFATNGAVLRGPAAQPLHDYTIKISNNTLTVS